MLFSFTSRIISALTAFIYPGYASYKTLSQRPASEAELERWLMYWSVLGCIVGVEYVAEWLVSWIPLYSTFKTLFLLYLALPQTQGATYVYTVHLRPFFAAHERQIDRTLAEVRVRVYRFVQEKARAVWTALLGSLAPGSSFGGGGGGGPSSTNSSPTDIDQPPPSLNNPVGGPSQLISSLWTSYGPGILAGGAALLSQTSAATLPGRVSTSTSTTTPSQRPSSSGRTVEERRRQLEAELAALPITPPMNNPARSHSSSSGSSAGGGIRERLGASGRFEQIDDSEAEGYEVGDHDDDFNMPGSSQSQSRKQSAGRQTGWFGGWGAGAGDSQSKGSYERVKDD